MRIDDTQDCMVCMGLRRRLGYRWCLGMHSEAQRCLESKHSFQASVWLWVARLVVFSVHKLRILERIDRLQVRYEQRIFR